MLQNKGLNFYGHTRDLGTKLSINSLSEFIGFKNTAGFVVVLEPCSKTLEGRYEVITEEVYDAHSSVAHGNCLIRDL